MPLRPPAGFIRPGYDPLKVPDAPTIGTATAGAADSGQVSVAFTAPSNVGGSAVSAYYAVSNPGQITSSGASSPVTVTGLTSGTSYTFTVWALNTYGPSPYSASSNSATPIGARGLFGGGSTGIVTNSITFISIASTGNSSTFGQLTLRRTNLGSFASATRGVFSCGYTADAVFSNVIDYVTISTTGNAIDFGDSTIARYYVAGCNSATRGLTAGGDTAGAGTGTNVIDYVTIASVGNAIDFGDLSVTRYGLAGCSSPTRGVFAGGVIVSGSAIYYNTIDYVTIATTGNALDFGDLTLTLFRVSGCSSSTRGIFAGGFNDVSGINTNVISYITIASAGNAIDFGDLINSVPNLAACSSTVRGVFAGGSTNVIQYVTIATTGNAIDFGDLPATTSDAAGCSNANGGL